jgi:hypothetical protein
VTDQPQLFDESRQFDQGRLFDSARRWAHAGLDAFVRQEPDYDFAVHHVAVSLEHLAKSYLCSVNPALISTDFDSLLHLVGHGAHASRPAHRVRTISLADANKRVRQLLKTAYPYDPNPSSDPVLAARNGIARAGLWPADEARRVLVLAVRRIDAILFALALERRQFWGRSADITTSLVNDAIADITLRVNARINAARNSFAGRYGLLSERERRAVIPVVAEIVPFPADHGARHRCPACDNQAWLDGDIETRWDLAFEYTLDSEERIPVVVLYPDRFRCTVCDLSLDGDELEHAGIEDTIELPDAEPDIPEPDQDWLSDQDQLPLVYDDYDHEHYEP